MSWKPPLLTLDLTEAQIASGLDPERLRHINADAMLAQAEAFKDPRRLEYLVNNIETLDAALLTPDFHRRLILLWRYLTTAKHLPKNLERDEQIKIRFAVLTRGMMGDLPMKRMKARQQIEQEFGMEPKVVEAILTQARKALPKL